MASQLSGPEVEEAVGREASAVWSAERAQLAVAQVEEALGTVKDCEKAVAALGLQRPAGASAQLSARAIEGFQPAGSWGAGEELELQPKGSGHNEGWLLTLGFVADGKAGHGFMARAWG